MNEIDRLREMLRRIVVDMAGVCDHPATCACSYAEAWRYLNSELAGYNPLGPVVITSERAAALDQLWESDSTP